MRMVKRSACRAAYNEVELHAGELQPAAVVRLQHLSDAVIVLETVREDSGIARLVSNSARYIFVPYLHYGLSFQPLQSCVCKFSASEIRV